MMKPQKRPFVVEIKQSRRGAKRPQHSIWGDLDLTAVKADVAESDPEIVTRPNTSAVSAAASGSSNSARILPALVAPAASKGPEDAAIGTVDPAPGETDGDGDSLAVPSQTPTKWVRRARLRRVCDKPLPAGQRWKRRLPKLLR
jgi:hypothetical protein